MSSSTKMKDCINVEQHSELWKPSSWPVEYRSRIVRGSVCLFVCPPPNPLQSSCKRPSGSIKDHKKIKFVRTKIVLKCFDRQIPCLQKWSLVVTAILTCGAASERNFGIKSGLANMRKSFFATKKPTVNGFCDKSSIYGLFADLPLTGRPQSIQ